MCCDLHFTSEMVKLHFPNYLFISLKVAKAAPKFSWSHRAGTQSVTPLAGILISSRKNSYRGHGYLVMHNKIYTLWQKLLSCTDLSRRTSGTGEVSPQF